MKFLHSACLTRPSPGILKQMMEEKIASQDLMLDWDVIYFLPSGYNCKSPIIKESKYFSNRCFNNKFMKLFGWIGLKIEYYFWIWRVSEKYDAILTRYSVHDLFLLIFLVLRKNKVFTVHHTIEIYELQTDKSIIGHIRVFLEKIMGKISITLNDGIVGVTKEIVDHEKLRAFKKNKKCYVYPNGILVKEGKIFDNKKNDNKVNILFVASEFVDWHGLDLLLEDIKKSTSDFNLHLIGNLIYKQDKLIADNDNRIILHGLQNIDYIKKIAENCDVALASFGLYRKGVKEGSTLKVREYFNYGLPVYSGHTDIFPTDFKFYYTGEAKINNILNFSQEMSQYSKEYIRDEAITYIDKKNILSNLHNHLSSISNADQ